MRLVVGLGNPGRRYAATFHNAGFRAVDRVAEALGAAWRDRGPAEVALAEAAGERVLLAKPKTFMNESGRAVAPLFRKHARDPGDLLLLHDELDLPPGVVRLKRGGGAGGHHGVRSVLEAVGDPSFLRVRIGIGRPPPGVDSAEFVLSPVPPEERERFGESVEAAAEAVLGILRDGFEKTRTRVNARRPAPPAEGAT